MKNNKLLNGRHIYLMSAFSLLFNSFNSELKAENYAFNNTDKKADLSSIGQQKTKKVSGTVLDQSGLSVIGANVIEQGTTNGVVTDFDGNFELEVSEGANLEVSYMGYLTQLIPVGNKSNFKIILQEDSQALDEVVVVGYGTQKKVNLTGAVTSLNGEELTGLPATNVANMLQGKLPGVSITSTSGQPGREGTSIRIRGVGTMNNADPMILVDGLDSSMNDVNPNAIENIRVLKDAAAAAIYGTRAANGVILITTTLGKPGKPVLNFNVYVGWTKAIKTPKHLSSAEYAAL